MAGTTINDGGLVQQAAIDAMDRILSVKITKKEADQVMGIPKFTAFQTLCSLAGAPSDSDTIQKLVTLFNNQLIKLYQDPNNISLMPFTNELFAIMRKQHTQIYLNTGFERNNLTFSADSNEILNPIARSFVICLAPIGKTLE